MSGFKVSLVTKAKEETEAFVKGVFPPECEVLFQTEEELRAGIADIDIMVPGHITVDGDLIRQGTKLKMIHAGTGYNNVDLDACNEMGCYVAVTPNVAAQSVAELVFSGFGALKNQIRMWDNVMKNGGWKSSDFIGVPEFKGKTLGVVGYGNIGKCVGKIGRGFSMNVIAHDPYCKDSGDGTELVDFDKLLSDSDYIALQSQQHLRSQLWQTSLPNCDEMAPLAVTAEEASTNPLESWAHQLSPKMQENKLEKHIPLIEEWNANLASFPLQDE